MTTSRLSRLSRSTALAPTRPPSFSSFSSFFAQPFSTSPLHPKAPASAAIVSKFQNPIVEQLWTQRAEAKALHAKMLTDPELMKSNPYTKITTPRPPSFSRTSIEYPFSTNPFLRETYKSPWGTVRIGKILEDLDACAGNIAYKHCSCQGEWESPLIVTAGVDRIQIKDRPTTDSDQILTGGITWIGSSSMEITMRVSTATEVWLEAKFTFVAREAKSNKATGIVPLLPETAPERALFELGAGNAAKKKETRKLATTSTSAYAASIEKTAAALLAEGAVLAKMPSLAPDNLILMKETELHNALVSQPQQRNMHNRIFGGFLMRRAFELAFSTAYVFGGSRPKFIEGECWSVVIFFMYVLQNICLMQFVCQLTRRYATLPVSLPASQSTTSRS